MTAEEFTEYYENMGYDVVAEPDDTGRWALCAYDEDGVMVDWYWL